MCYFPIHINVIVNLLLNRWLKVVCWLSYILYRIGIFENVNIGKTVNRVMGLSSSYIYLCMY